MRYNREELCKRYHKERKVFYSNRNRLIKKQQSGKLTDKQFSQSEKKIKQLSKKIDSYSVKIFKCGKKYNRARSYRLSLVKKVNRLKNEAKRIGIGKTSSNRLFTEIGIISEEIRKLNDVMKKPIFLEKGVIKVYEDTTTDFFIEDVVVWELKQSINKPIDSGGFDSITIEGKDYSIIEDKASVWWAIDDFIADVHASQSSSKVRTPMVRVELYLKDKKIILYRL